MTFYVLLALGMVGFGWLFGLVGGIWGIINAFRGGAGWGFGILISGILSGLPFVGLLWLGLCVAFWFKHWNLAKVPFFLNLTAGILIISAIFVNAYAYDKGNEETWELVEAKDPIVGTLRGIMDKREPIPEEIEGEKLELVPVPMVLEEKDGELYVGPIGQTILAIPLNILYVAGEMEFAKMSEQEKALYLEEAQSKQADSLDSLATPTTGLEMATPAPQQPVDELERLRAWHQRLIDMHNNLDENDPEAVEAYRQENEAYQRALQTYQAQ